MIYKEVIGVVGGMGSYATLHIFNELINAFPADKEWERPRIIIDNNCIMPSRVRAILYNEKKTQLIEEMIDSINNLINCGCTKIFLGCNTAHAFLDDIYNIQPGLKKYIIDMIEKCIIYINKKNIKEVCVIASEGTHYTEVYKRRLEKNEIIVKERYTWEQERVFIEAVKTNQISKQTIEDFEKYLSNIKCNTIILGCTEFSALYKKCCKNEIKKVIIDPIECIIEYLYLELRKGEVYEKSRDTLI